MTKERAKVLQSIGFCWDSHEAAWWDRYNDLKRYNEEFGDCMVPTKYPSNPQLGTWIHHQRRQYRMMLEGKPSHMTSDRANALLSIGFVWSPRVETLKKKEEHIDFAQRVDSLRQYKRKFGSCSVPKFYEPNPGLGTWVHAQREEFRRLKEGKPSTLNKANIDTLDVLGFIW
eukprot:CAMPEP_0185732788 /NCGR_PEP_ID=MMETSP1171-20130828/17467_1 /TAXON_ID=374046 /ORGANISM="Helicotheca tamensis, Strain CCMP826" /LENGTH=171 /DNA_ID=CAMNT_0028402363 /DNA_START=384 /DNA_END=896 /DNA_ORIENTATION=-